MRDKKSEWGEDRCPGPGFRRLTADVSTAVTSEKVDLLAMPPTAS